MREDLAHNNAGCPITFPLTEGIVDPVGVAFRSDVGESMLTGLKLVFSFFFFKISLSTEYN